MDERSGKSGVKAYPHDIDMNVIPHIDVFLENDYTKEEMKMVNETKKIMGDENIRLTATTVRVPVKGGHSESVNVEFENDFKIEDVKNILRQSHGIVLVDEPARNSYPMPIHAEGKDEVFVGRIRRDESQPNSLNMWIVADNLRKGAATNAVQIAEYLVKHKLV
jgi:aspartate-semialdehyde dehydrogenase